MLRAGTEKVATIVFVTRFLKVAVMDWLVELYATKRFFDVPASLNTPNAGMSATIDVSTCPNAALVYAQYLAMALVP